MYSANAQPHLDTDVKNRRDDEPFFDGPDVLAHGPGLPILPAPAYHPPGPRPAASASESVAFLNYIKTLSPVPSDAHLDDPDAFLKCFLGDHKLPSADTESKVRGYILRLLDRKVKHSKYETKL
jgi:hypothetical protein